MICFYFDLYIDSEMGIKFIILDYEFCLIGVFVIGIFEVCYDFLCVFGDDMIVLEDDIMLDMGDGQIFLCYFMILVWCSIWVIYEVGYEVVDENGLIILSGSLLEDFKEVCIF